MERSISKVAIYLNEDVYIEQRKHWAEIVAVVNVANNWRAVVMQMMIYL